MKKLFSLVLSSGLALMLIGSNVFADSAKGQRYFLKFISPNASGINGAKFAKMHTKAEWEALFADDGKKFIVEFTKKYPDTTEYLNSKKFQRALQHIKDFAIEYSSDSGNVPTCG